MNDTTYLLTSLLPSLEFVFDVPANILCNKCDHPALQPWRTTCKHLLCWKCLNETMKGLQKCHVDGTPINIGEVVLEKEVDEIVRKLQVRCPYQKHGCGKVVSLGDITTHIGICNFIPVYCPKECGITISRKDLVQHIISTCAGPSIPQPLKKCSSSQSIQRNSSHLELLSTMTTTTTAKHPTVDRDAVIIDLQCQIQKLNENIGQLLQKLDTQTKNQQNLNLPELLKVKNSESLKDFCNRHDNALSIEMQTSSVLCEINGFSKDVLNELQQTSATSVLNKLLDMTSIILQRIDVMQNQMITKENLDLTIVPILERADVLQSSLRHHYKKLESLERKYDKLRDRHLRVLDDLETTDHNIELVVKGFEDFAKKLDTQNRIWLKVIDTLEGPTPVGGNFGEIVWKIDNYTKKKRKAEQGTETEQTSPAFYSHRFGYKLCLRAYLNGYYDGEGSHLSLYICVMKGPYDDVLTWPLKGKFTFSLLDQRLLEKKDHFIEFLDPKKFGTNFTKWSQKPQSERNVGFGLPEFISHVKLEHVNSSYLRNDTLYIKAVVDCQAK